MTTAPLQLEIGGMTCAACAGRVERSLSRLGGVTASVNYATEKATVTLADDADALPTIDELVAAIEKAGYSATPVAPPSEARASTAQGDAPDPLADARRRLAIVVALTVPVLVLSMVPPLQFPNWQWLVLALSSPVAVWGAWPFHRAAFMNARHGTATMDTLISVGVGAAFGWSLYTLFFGEAGMTGMVMSLQLFGSPDTGSHEIYLEVAAAVTAFMLAGRYLEAKAKRASGEALRALLELSATDATVLRDGVETRVAVDQLVVGDRFIARPGDTIATDGLVRDGATAVDTSVMTGESKPVEVAVDARVVGGTVNVGPGVITVEATRIGADTELARLGRLVEEAQTGKARVQRIADRVSAIFVPVVMVLSLLALLGWLLFGGTIEQAFTAAVTTLIIACPCALGLATPTALLVGTGRGSQLGILIRGPEVLEQTRRVDTIVLDKTGTLTTGRMRVTAVLPAAGIAEERVLAAAAGAESGSVHPVAAAIVEAAREAGAATGAVEGFQAHDGAGVSAVVDDRAVAVGRADWLTSAWSVEVGDDVRADIAHRENDGMTVVAVAIDGAYAGLIAISDAVRPEAGATIARLRALGLTPVLLTGDNAGAAARVAEQLGIDDVRSGVTPVGKLEAIRGLQADGHVVAMLGDGVNDAAALAAADLGIAMGSGTDAAMAASDLTIVSGDLSLVPDAVRLARRTLRTIIGNLFWAFGYNTAAIPVAMMGLLSPVLAALAMAVSSLFVLGNSLRLRSFAPEPR
ncbi:heavy metal translocating P-type ATPase [Microcella alkaliphila]|uniref:Cation-transporting P-type ATPase B n=1 Tax=Microcella alkaliphila TaxID=279828 RepID=A0A0U5BLT4_9MICO|nr:heavy metal translocating P-type ATPase [Microcella alkaliphila]BAU31126.1 heavy metal translocating P-type ATPase [Microcella alkaliphila]